MIDTNSNCCECRSCTGKYCASKVPIFSTLHKEQIEKISDMIIRRKYKKGQMIFFEGDVSDKLYIINSGKIKIFKYTKEAKEQILYILSEGDFIGDMSLLKKTTFDFNAEALEDVSVCMFAKDSLDEMVRANPEIMFKILEEVHDRLVNLESLVQTLSTKDVEARLAGLLIGFAKDFGVKTTEGILIEMPLSREEMANYIGITRETISRKLTVLQEESIIELKGNRKIIIKDMESLESIV